MINYLDDDKNEDLKKAINFTFDEEYLRTDNPSILDFIHYVYVDKLAIAIDELLSITYKHNFTTLDILNCYWEKWQKNMKRIGNEWN